MTARELACSRSDWNGVHLIDRCGLPPWRSGHLQARGRPPCQIAAMAVMSALLVERISKSPEEDNEAGELDEAEKVVGVVFPADEDATLPLYPGEEAFDQPT